MSPRAQAWERGGQAVPLDLEGGVTDGAEVVAVRHHAVDEELDNPGLPIETAAAVRAKLIPET